MAAAAAADPTAAALGCSSSDSSSSKQQQLQPLHQQLHLADPSDCQHSMDFVECTKPEEALIHITVTVSSCASCVPYVLAKLVVGGRSRVSWTALSARGHHELGCKLTELGCFRGVVPVIFLCQQLLVFLHCLAVTCLEHNVILVQLRVVSICSVRGLPPPPACTVQFNSADGPST